jgi:hypothetical protein
MIQVGALCGTLVCEANLDTTSMGALGLPCAKHCCPKLVPDAFAYQYRPTPSTITNLETGLIQLLAGFAKAVRTVERSIPSRSLPKRSAWSSRPTMSPSSNRADELRLSFTTYFCEINRQ